MVKALVLSVIALVGLLANPAAYAQSNTVTVVHELGEAVVTKNPKTVVVFDYATLDSLDEMGIEVTGLPKSSLPPYLSKFKDSKYVDVGTLFEPNFERIYELQPDVIFISTRQASQYAELQRIAPTVYLAVEPNDYLGSVTKNLRILGDIFGKEEFIAQEVNQLQQAFQSLRQQVDATGSNALLIMANDGALSAYGPGSRFGVVHQEMGFPPADPKIEVATHGQNIAFEYLISVDPDYLLVIDRAATVGGSISAKQVLDNPLVRMTSAYKNDRILYLNSQVWYVASGGLTATKLMLADIEGALGK